MAKKKSNIKPVEEVVENIVETPMDDIMGERFGIYAKDVIQNRAIPDARDGMKPVQRRIIFAMFDEGNLFSKPTKKCAHTVGSVMGKYHPHGDSSIYEALARMSQNWVMRYPLIDFQGNNGSIDGDPPAAYRYTEARLSEIAEEMVRDIKKNTVDMQLTFDDSSLEPMVLPARFPNLLANGSQGIAVGVATDIPPHNLRELIAAIIYRINHKRATNADLRQFVLGPDFPTGGIIYRSEGLDSIYETGHGRIEIAAKSEIRFDKEINQIVITEIPYGVNKSSVLKEIDVIAHNHNIDGVIEVRDESDRKGLSIVIDVKKDTDINVISEYLFNKTQLRTSYTANMVAIEGYRPKTLNLLGMVDAYINHQIEVIRRRSEFDLEKFKGRLHLVEGLIKAISMLDEVVHTIRSSNNKADAKDNLISRFAFSNEQAEAIVMLQLYKLTNTDVTVLQEEKKSLLIDIETLEGILADENKLNRVIIDDLKDINKKYGDDRRSKVEDRGEIIQIDKRDLIAKEEVIIALTRDGYIKRSSLKSFKSSGDNCLPGVKNGDSLIASGASFTTDNLIIFTSLGNYLIVPVYEIADGKWKDEGKHLNTIVTLDGNEKCIAVFSARTVRSDLYFALISKHGQIKRTVVSDFSLTRYSRPINCMRLARDDELVGVDVTTGNSSILVACNNGTCSLFNENDVSILSLKASGVKAINGLKKTEISSMLVFAPQERSKLLEITKEGHARFIDSNYFDLTARLGKIQYAFKAFKSDPQTLLYIDKIDKSASFVLLRGLLANGESFDFILNDFHVTPIDRYAKKNLDFLADGVEIASIYKECLPVIDDSIIAYQPDNKTSEKEGDASESSADEYEQISIFDAMGD